MLSVYPACFFKDEDGYTVVFPDLENGNLSTCGKGLNEALMMAIECLASYIYTEEKLGHEVPNASLQSNINIDDVEKPFIEAGCSPSNEKFINLVSVDVATYAKEHFEKSIKKTLTIPVWLNDLALEQNINFSQVLQEALLMKLNN